MLPGLLAALLLIFGLALRLYDITDQPIDFHPTRQLRGAIIARGMYYDMMPGADPAQRQQALDFWGSTGQYEPSILEKLSAYTYLLLGSEQIWVPRLYSAIFWVLGGIALLALARRLTAGRWAPALAALTYYLVLPFGVQASRTIQPDPLMVMWIIFTFYALYRWSEWRTAPVGVPSWKWALAAGFLGGIAILTKVVAAYPIAGAAIAVVLTLVGQAVSLPPQSGQTVRLSRNALNLAPRAAFLRRPAFLRSPLLLKRPQLRVIAQALLAAALMLLPSAYYYLSRGGRASEFFSSWTLSLAHLLVEPSVYARWFNLVQSLLGLAVLLLALAGIMIAHEKARWLLLGMWLGYLAYGLFLPYQMYTHNYYHLMLIPMTALGLAPALAPLLKRAERQGLLWRAGLAAVLLVGVTFSAWTYLAPQRQENYQTEVTHWQEIASKIPADGKTIALTQDYGYRLMYYGWRKVVLWPIVGERELADLRGRGKEFEDLFNNRIEGNSYFLITAFNQYERQPDLEEILEANYPLLAEGQGYQIYDLEHPLVP
jgi:hypothetical protein